MSATRAANSNPLVQAASGTALLLNTATPATAERLRMWRHRLFCIYSIKSCCMSLELHRKDGCAFLTQVELCFNVLASVCLMWCKIQLQAGQHTGDESVQRKVCGISCGKVKSISKDLTLQEQKITCSVTTACSLFLIIRRKADVHSNYTQNYLNWRKVKPKEVKPKEVKPKEVKPSDL